MTTVCVGNGPSQLGPGLTPLQSMGASAIAEWLIGAEMAWYAEFAYGVGQLVFDWGGLCLTDPVPLPNVDGQRVMSYLASTQGAQFLREDAQAILSHYLWFVYCQCVTGTQPTPSPPLAQPTGYQTDGQNSTTFAPGDCGQGPQIFTSITLDSSGNGTASFVGGTFPAAAQWYQLETGLQFNPPPPVGIPHDIEVVVQEHSSSSVLGVHSFTYPAQPAVPRPLFASYPLQPGTQTLTAAFHCTALANQTIQVNAFTRAYCSSIPSVLRPDCCPPDPNLVVLINQVLQLEQTILASIGGNTAYRRGTAHAGLSGTGSLGVTGLRGIAIDLTAGSSAIPPLEGNPPYQWNLGWASMNDGGGMLIEQRFTRTHQVWLPASANLASQIGYFFFPGITATITELLPA